MIYGWFLFSKNGVVKSDRFYFYWKCVILIFRGGKVIEVIKSYKGGYSCNAVIFVL